MRPDRIYALIEGKMAQVEDLVRAEFGFGKVATPQLG